MCMFIKIKGFKIVVVQILEQQLLLFQFAVCSANSKILYRLSYIIQLSVHIISKSWINFLNNSIKWKWYCVQQSGSLVSLFTSQQYCFHFKRGAQPFFYMKPVYPWLCWLRVGIPRPPIIKKMYATLILLSLSLTKSLAQTWSWSLLAAQWLHLAAHCFSHLGWVKCKEQMFLQGLI